MDATIRLMTPADVEAVVGLQRAAFPPPFSEDLLWKAEHLDRHLELFPDAQWVAEIHGKVVASCSNTRITDPNWQKHASWDETVGGPFLKHFAPNGTTLYGLDVTVHPNHRRKGIARGFYAKRFEFVRSQGLKRYGTACRVPDFSVHREEDSKLDVSTYVARVLRQETIDRTLTPLLKIGLTPCGVVFNYMEDPESDHAACLLEWVP